MSVEICPAHQCTGCGACAAVCPKQCITLKPNPQGHLLPKIDAQTCVNCNLCRKTCPVNRPVPLHTPQSCYAGWAKEEQDRTTSSSGAASSVLASYIIQQGGVVYGVALQDNKIQHIRVSRAEDLIRLKGSKYVYSYAAEVYGQIKQDLAAGKCVLFTGTPCQNAAVYNVIGEHPNLFLANLICHGTPSMQMLKDHLRSKHITEIQSLQFRNNNEYDFSCNNYRAKTGCRSNEYVCLFLKGATYRHACYRCAYARAERAGDLTLGDFWGLGKQTPFDGGDTSKGCSVILVNTDKGRALLDACREQLRLFPRDYTEAVAGNDQLRGPVPYGRNARLFNKFYPRLSFNKAAWLSAGPLLSFIWVKQLIQRYCSKKMQQQFFKIYRFIRRKK